MKKVSPTQRDASVFKKKERMLQANLIDAINMHTGMLTHLAARVVFLERKLMQSDSSITLEILDKEIEEIMKNGRPDSDE